MDSRMPGAQRFRINLIGMGVVERSSLPELRPNIPAPAPGFNLGMIQSNPGNCPSFHSHTKKEAFMPLMRPWDATLLEEEGDHEIILQTFNSIHISLGVYRGYCYFSEGRGTLLTLISGPDASKGA